MARRKKKKAGVTVPSYDVPPTGTFDPSLEAQRGQSERGLSDLIFDTGKGDTRARQDLATRLAELDRSFGRGNEDINAGVADIGTKRARTGEDFDYAHRGLNRNYASLARRQGQAANATGQLKGGTLAASAAMRAKNKAFEFEPLQRNFTRANQDYDTGLGRLALQRSRLGEDYSTNTNLAGRDFGRGFEDRSDALSRARREQGIFESNISSSEYFDANQRDPTLQFNGPTTAPNKPRRRRRR